MDDIAVGPNGVIVPVASDPIPAFAGRGHQPSHVARHGLRRRGDRPGRRANSLGRDLISGPTPGNSKGNPVSVQLFRAARHR